MTARCLVFALPIAFLVGCSRQSGQDQVQAAKANDPPAVDVALAETRRVERSISVTGSLHPDETVTVSSEVAGRVAVIHFDFGQKVRRGAVVADLDTRELRLQLERTQAALAQALARIGLEPGQEDVTPASTPAVRQAEALLEDARSKYESALRLVKSGDVSQQRFTEMEQAYLARQAALDAARHELRTQLATIQALKADVRLAEKRLSDATMRAPFDSAVTARHVSPGQYIRENTPVLTLVKTNPLRLRVEVPEPAVASVRLGTTLTFTTDAIAGRQFHAVVRELNPSLEARSRSLTVEARLNDNDPRLLPGMFVQVSLVTARDVEIVVVPRQAIYTVAGLSKVFSVRDGRIVEHRIVPGLEKDGWVEAPGGQVRAGDAVAVSNLAGLIQGAAVKTKQVASSKG